MVCKITSVDQSKNLVYTLLFEKKEMKNTLYYLFIEIIGLPLRILNFVVYPIVFLFKQLILDWAIKHFYESSDKVFLMNKGYKKWKVYFHPYFWMFCLTTGLTNQWHGDEWFMEDYKKKHPYTSDYSLSYFWVCYRWQALRNGCWALAEWFFREGEWIEGSEKVSYCHPREGYIYKHWAITPQLKWDEGNDGGKVLRFPPDGDIPLEEIWLYTHLGKKKITFTTHKGNRRFMYAFCKVIYWKHHKLIIEHQFGWNWWNGIPILHFKHIIKKL